MINAANHQSNAALGRRIVGVADHEPNHRV
jgi:hypothetical protein